MATATPVARPITQMIRPALSASKNSRRARRTVDTFIAALACGADVPVWLVERVEQIIADAA